MRQKKLKDKLNIVFNIQYKLQEYLGIYKKIKNNKSMRQQYINQMILALHEESVEIMKETAYKNPNLVPFGWKKNQFENTEKFKEEIIDIFHFIINLSIISGMDAEELFKRYINKNKENIKRQKINY